MWMRCLCIVWNRNLKGMIFIFQDRQCPAGWSKAVNAIYLYYMTGCISRSIRALWSMRMKHQSKSRETAGIRCATVICGFIVLVQKMDNSQWSCMNIRKPEIQAIRRNFWKDMKERSSVMGLKHIIRLRGKMHTSQLQAAGLMQGGNMSRSVKN